MKHCHCLRRSPCVYGTYSYNKSKSPVWTLQAVAAGVTSKSDFMDSPVQRHCNSVACTVWQRAVCMNASMKARHDVFNVSITLIFLPSPHLSFILLFFFFFLNTFIVVFDNLKSPWKKIEAYAYGIIMTVNHKLQFQRQHSTPLTASIDNCKSILGKWKRLWKQARNDSSSPSSSSSSSSSFFSPSSYAAAICLNMHERLLPTFQLIWCLQV